MQAGARAPAIGWHQSVFGDGRFRVGHGRLPPDRLQSQPMAFAQLKDFLVVRMKMSHIYQPLLIRSLVESGGQATVRQLAAEFLVRDESQLLYYEKRLKEMPVRVLRRHGIIEQDGDLIRLRSGKLDLRQQAEIRRLCEEKICSLVEARGYRVWSYQSPDLGEISDDLRFRVLKEGGSRCALCGARAKDTPLDVDHIIPRSRRGAQRNRQPADPVRQVQPHQAGSGRRGFPGTGDGRPTSRRVRLLWRIPGNDRGKRVGRCLA